MKNKNFLFLILLWILPAQAQIYKSVLGNDTARWSIIGLADWELTDEWMTNKTEIINDLNYKSLTHYSTMGIPPINLSDDIFWQYYKPDFSEDNTKFYLRESDDYSKLYLYDMEKSKEFLIADLDLNVGDKFYLPKDLSFYDLCSPNEFLIVDSVYTENGLKHVQLNSYKWYFDTKLTFVEGIGPNLGIVYIYGGLYMNKNVFCLQCFKNDNIFYRNNSAGEKYQSKSCYFNDIPDKVETIQSEVYRIVNHLTSIQILFDNQSKRVFTLYDIAGKILFVKSNDGNEIIISKSVIDKGIYILKINDHSYRINHSIKFIIQ